VGEMDMAGRRGDKGGWWRRVGKEEDKQRV